MLILSRSNGESFVIDGEIAVTVIAVKGDVVKLGIEASKKMPIHRNEILQKIRASVPDLAVQQH
jgi:carbon storage regulator